MPFERAELNSPCRLRSDNHPLRLVDFQELVSSGSSVSTRPGELADDVSYKGPGVSKEHQGPVEVVEFVIDAREAGTHAAFDDHDGPGLVDVEDGHAVDRAARVGARCRVGQDVGAD